MSKGYWVENDKKVNPHSPTLMYSGPCPPAENEKEEEKRRRKRRGDVNVGGSIFPLLAMVNEKKK